MKIPSTIQQLVVLVVAVLPGVIYQVTRTRLAGPSPHNSDASARVLRAIGASAIFDVVYLVLLGPWLLQTIRAAAPCPNVRLTPATSSPPAAAAQAAASCHADWQSRMRDLALAGLLLVVVVPALSAVLVVLFSRGARIQARLVALLQGRGLDDSHGRRGVKRARHGLARRIEALGYEPTLTWDFAFTRREPC